MSIKIKSSAINVNKDGNLTPIGFVTTAEEDLERWYNSHQPSSGSTSSSITGPITKDNLDDSLKEIIEKVESLSTVATTGDYNDLENLPISDEGFGPDDFQKAMLQYFDVVGEKDATMKPYSQKIRNSILNMEDFGKMGSGLFIHWGIYSVPAGHYEGTKQTGSTIDASKTDINYNCEWIMRDLAIPKETYKAYETQFTGENFDTDAICEMAAGLGMKYIIITAKHHEGFCLAPTEHTTGWDIRTAACRNTILDELKASCEKYKLKFCIYYSQYWDWMNEGGFGLNHGSKWATADLYTRDQHLAYCQKATAQIQELIEKYKPYILWYDPGAAYDSEYVNVFKTAEKEKYPNIITNDRLDYNRNYGDYGTGERTIYLRSLPYGESCFTLNNTWGYSVNNENASSYYSLQTMLKQFMLYTISYGQNCVLNIGPKPDGSLPANTTASLNKIKTFIDTYVPGGFQGYYRVNTKCRPKWGYAVGMPDNKIICFISTAQNKNYSNIIIDGVDTVMLKQNGVKILTPGTNASYTILDDCRIQINGLALDTESQIGVVELDYESSPILLDYVTATNHEAISSRVFPVTGNYYDTYYCRYKYKESQNVSMSTRLKWHDADKEATIKLNYELPTQSDINTVIVITDEADETKTQTFTYGSNETLVGTKFNFEENHNYLIDFSTTGSIADYFVFNGFSIDYNEVENVTGITVSPSSLELAQGGYAQLTANVIPAYATNTNVTWSSSNTDIVTVSSGGFVSAGTTKGTATITATTEDGGFTASCSVEVKDIAIESIALESNSINLYQAETRQLNYTILPANAGNMLVNWTSSNPDIISVVDGVVSVQPEASGSATITVTTQDGNKTDSCTIYVIPETYDYKFEAASLDGSADQGDDTGIALFSDELQNWTLFGFAQNSVNPNADNNATLYQIVVNASPWSGLRTDADNSNYPTSTSAVSPLVPRFLMDNDRYCNPITGELISGKPSINPNGMIHPVCFSRNGTEFKFSIDGIHWTTFPKGDNTTNITAQLNRLKPCTLTVGFDYRRSGGQLTTTKYRLLKTNNPCCVAINYTSEYPFWKLYNQYDASRVLGEVVEE